MTKYLPLFCILFFINALTEVQQKEISNKEETAFFIFGFSFNYKLGEDVSFPLKEGDKITITITKKTTDKEINASLIALTGKELSVEELKTVKKYQEYVSGSKFSAEITVVEPPEDEQNNH
ncbi:hypothetical protein S100390_v1c05870 [Spiroplasma sp. NBRC 100390]|uniref:hypothetical protein n=1 Tax=unclassified Spiroplasma TaxID=2637901 RepID=UPI0008929B81|nr:MULTISPECIES: hypothetical protein [unclassified Spiroplasma]AOX43924.1 hypothetical protein STU14_v1c05870 [Spiroplasma sp. TU-14]APE13394.1 hypothetical protein S100390_v1c05870 [Spiroplasma sp. NBRC 100390]